MTKPNNTSTWMKLATLALIAALGIGLLGDVEVASAQGTAADPGRLRIALVMGESLLSATADALHLTQFEILQQMQSGNQTLAEVIKASSGDLAAIEASAKTDLTSKINQAVTDNKLTQAQADALLKNLDTALDKLATSPWPVNALVNLIMGAAKDLLDAAVKVTKLSQQDIIKQMADGKTTLAEVIKTSGNDVEAIKTAAKTTITGQLNQAVKANKLTQDQADAILNNIDPALDKLLNSPWPNLQNADPLARLLRGRATGVLLKETATESNITQRDLLKETRTGKTLARIATEHGADPAKIITATTSTLTDGINTLAKNGRISQDQANQLIGTLPTLLQQIMNTPFPRPTGKGNGNGSGNPGAPATPPAQATPSL